MKPRYLRDLAIYAHESLVDTIKGGFVQRFHRESCCITEPFLSHVSRKLETNGVAKVFIELMEPSEFNNSASQLNPSCGVLECGWPFDFLEYLSSDDLMKKRRLAGTLREIFLYLAQSHRWDDAIIRTAFAELEARDYVFGGLSKASWLSPDSRHRVRVAFDWQLDAIRFSAVLFRNRSSTELVRRELGELPPQEGQLNNAILREHGKWLNNTQFELQTTDFLRRQWRVSFVDAM